MDERVGRGISGDFDKVDNNLCPLSRKVSLTFIASSSEILVPFVFP